MVSQIEIEHATTTQLRVINFKQTWGTPSYTNRCSRTRPDMQLVE